MTNRRSKFACSKIPSSTLAMLFALQPTRACVFDISADRNVWYGRLCDRCDYMETASLLCDLLRLFAICDLRSTIVCDHMEVSLKLTLRVSVSMATIYCLYLLRALPRECLSYSMANKQAIRLQIERRILSTRNSSSFSIFGQLKDNGSDP